MGEKQEDRRIARTPMTVEGSPSRLPAAMFGYKNGAAWIADDVFVTRGIGRDLLVERWDGQGVRSAHVRADSEGFLRAIWAKLNEVAVDGAPYSAL